MSYSSISSYPDPSALRFANYLSPILHETYDAIVQYLGSKLEYPASLTIGASTDEFAEDLVDAGFLCGLLYIHTTRLEQRHIELLAAPVLTGTRYRGQPIYFSDIIVRKESPYTSWADLRGSRWAYNEIASHSGWNLVHYSLHQRGETRDYFAQLLKSGSHLNSLEMVLVGDADATAIDSHVLDVLLQNDPKWTDQIRVIDSFGPSPIPPLAVSARLDGHTKDRLRELLTTMHLDEKLAQILRKGGIERFVEVKDEDYTILLHMFDTVQALEGS
jgi:phosphonate transport system substrate-binding protein